MQDLDQAVGTFVEKAQEVIHATYKGNFEPLLAVQKGQSYYKIVKTNRDSGAVESVYAFIAAKDINTRSITAKTGDVLKPAGFKRPARHARGNVFNEDNGAGCCGPYSIAYLR